MGGYRDVPGSGASTNSVTCNCIKQSPMNACAGSTFQLNLSLSAVGHWLS